MIKYFQYLLAYLCLWASVCIYIKCAGPNVVMQCETTLHRCGSKPSTCPLSTRDSRGAGGATSTPHFGAEREEGVLGVLQILTHPTYFK